jgi:hypothetical protein
MVEQSYDECIETTIRALTWPGGFFADDSFADDGTAVPEDNPDQIERAEALVRLAKGRTVDQLGQKLSDMGVDDPCLILESLLKSDRVATGLKSPVHGVARRGDGFIVFLVGEDPVPGHQVLLRLLPSPCDSAAPAVHALSESAEVKPSALRRAEEKEAIKWAAELLREDNELTKEELYELLFGLKDKRTLALREKEWRTPWPTYSRAYARVCARLNRKVWKQARKLASLAPEAHKGRRLGK